MKSAISLMVLVGCENTNSIQLLSKHKWHPLEMDEEAGMV